MCLCVFIIDILKYYLIKPNVNKIIIYQENLNKLYDAR